MSLKSVSVKLWRSFKVKISVKVKGSHVAQNIVRLSKFFCELCLMSLKSILVKLWMSFKAKISVKVNLSHVAQNMACL